MSNTEEIIDSNILTESYRNSRIKNFQELLDKLNDIDDKKKQLWREIYENAICDRQSAYAMFVKLVVIVEDKTTEHAVHGKTISSYLERMSRANDQLIRLAELVAKADEKTESIDTEKLFDQIQKGGKK